MIAAKGSRQLSKPSSRDPSISQMGDKKNWIDFQFTEAGP